jgi:prolyl oligopeptidase
MRHRLGTPQSEDELVLEFTDNPRMFATPVASHDGRWLFVHLSEGTDERNRLWVYPMSDADGMTRIGEPLRVVDEVRARYELVRTDGDLAYLHTDADAPLGKVVRVDLAGLDGDGAARFEDVVSETGAALDLVKAAGDDIVAVYLEDAQPRIRRFGLDGIARDEVPVQAGAVLAVHGEVGSDEAFIGTASVMTPSTSYVVDLADGAATVLDDLAPAGRDEFVPPTLVSERRRATSRDGTQVPYFLIRRSDLDLDAPRPTLLYGYGGFNIPVLADFRATFAGWLAAGGVLAVANLRGGSEFGATWHDAGRLTDKQNVFDDFAAVGDHLVAQGVTTHGQLAVHGGSNGGLLVGATLTQRPDLAAVALPAVGVLDMLRFHLFTIGAAWVSDFGSPEDPEMFDTLLAYSPLHNVKEGGAYPATLVLTGDHDDRVVPAHSFKFVATLQRAQAGEAPVLARIETSTGHGPGKPAAVLAAECADLLTFAAEHTGLVPSRQA